MMAKSRIPAHKSVPFPDKGEGDGRGMGMGIIPGESDYQNSAVKSLGLLVSLHDWFVQDDLSLFYSFGVEPAHCLQYGDN